MRKSLSLVAVFAVALSACYENPNTATKVGPFGEDLSGTWTLTSMNGAPLPFPVNPTTTATRSELISATMTMNYNVEKTWEMHVQFRNTTTATGAVVLVDSTRRGTYYTSTDPNGGISLTMGQNTPSNATYPGVPPTGGVAADKRSFTTRAGVYCPTQASCTPTTYLTAPGFFYVITNQTAINGSPIFWVWTKQ